MRSYCSIYIDAGYLLAGSATLVTGSSLRGATHVDHAALIRALVAQAEQSSGLPILRVYWYDSAGGAHGTPDRQQERIGMIPRVKVRLGRLSPAGEQKGVDLRIGLDLVNHSRTRNADVMYLVSGDDDLTEAVEEAQSFGVQVAVLAVPTREGRLHAVAQHLQRAADDLLMIDVAEIESAVQRVTAPSQAVSEAMGSVASAAPKPAPPAPAPSAPRPSPASIVPSPGTVAAARRPSAPVPSEPVPSTSVPSDPPVVPGRVTYSTASGDGATENDYLAMERAIDEVVSTMLDNWLQSSTRAQRDSLMANRPMIPREIDGALLVDLSHRLDIYDLNEHDRHEIRNEFWRQLDNRM